MPSARALRAGRAIIELSLLTGPVKKQLADLQAQGRKFSRSFANMGALGGGGAAGGGGFAALRNIFVGSAAATALAWPVKLAANIEHAAATMSVFTGDAKLARAMLLDLQQFSAISMLSFDELATGAKLLMRVGDVAQGEVNPAIKSLAALAGGSVEEFQALTLAFAQVGSAGRLQGEEMRQFKNTAFNPLREIAERTGESLDEVKQRMEAGAVPFAEVMQALLASTAAGGRFAGILETMSNTLLGQLGKALTNFKNAILPLGEELLKPITDFLRAVNGAMPGLAKWVKANKQWVTTVAAALAGTAVVAVAFTTLGLGITLLGTALGGVVSLFTGGAALLMILFNPLTLLSGAVAYLAAQFVVGTDTGRQMVASLSGWFTSLAAIGQQMLGGLADALIAGDIEAAGEVLWAGLDLLWQRGTHALEQHWIAFKEFTLPFMTELVFDLEKLWVNFFTRMKGLWALHVQDSRTFGEKIGHALSRSSDPVLAAEQDAAHNNALRNIEREGAAEFARLQSERDNALAGIEAARSTAADDRARTAGQDLAASEEELAAARRRLNLATEKAKYARLDLENKKTAAGSEPFPWSAGAALALASASTAPIALFDTRFSQQQIGGRDEEKRILMKIEKNTRGGGGGLPVI